MTGRIALRTAGLLLLAAGTAGADGTIDTSNATIAAGAAPTPGTVTIDPCAPPAPPPRIHALADLEGQSTMVGTVGSFPDAGTGADGVFAPITSANMAGGTYEYSGFNVAGGVTITYDGPVTILVNGTVTIDGALETDTVGASITIVCTNNLTMGQFGDIRARSDQSPVTIDVAGNFVSLAVPGQVDCSITGRPGVILRTHGLQPGTGDVALGALSVAAGQGSGEILATRGITADGASVSAGNGDLTVRAFGGDIDGTDFDLSIGSAQRLTVDAWGALTLRGGSQLSTGTGDLALAAHGGDLTIEDQVRMSTSTGDIDVGAALSLVFGDEARASTSTGDIAFTAYGGDADVGPPGQFGSVNLSTSSGNVTVRARGDVALNAGSQVTLGTGDLSLRAHAGDVRFDGNVDLRVTTGDAEVLATGAVSGELDGLEANAIVVAAGAGGIDIETTGVGVTSDNADLDVVAIGRVRLAGSFQSRGAASVVSLDGDVDVSSASVTTDGGVDTAPIRIASHSGTATIDANGAGIESGAGTSASGDVSLSVHAPTAIQPRSISLVLPGTRKRPQLKLSGWVDIGPQDASLAGPANFIVGSHDVLLLLDSKANGRRFEHREPGLTFRLTPPRKGGTRAAFALTVAGDLTNSVPENGPLNLRLLTGRFQARGTVFISGGKFRLGRTPGTLLRPDAFLEKVLVRLKGGGRDSFRLIAGYAAPSPLPTQPPDVRLELGPNIAATIPGDRFQVRGSKFVFKGDIAGVTNVTLDVERGRIVARGRNVDFGDGDEGQVPLRVVVGVGATEATLHVGALRTAKVLRY